jgi:hypothetical protein
MREANSASEQAAALVPRHGVQKHSIGRSSCGPLGARRLSFGAWREAASVQWLYVASMLAWGSQSWGWGVWGQVLASGRWLQECVLQEAGGRVCHHRRMSHRDRAVIYCYSVRL